MQKLSYEITTSPGVLYEKYDISGEGATDLRRFMNNEKNDIEAEISQLQELVQRYPNTPHFQDYLVEAYLKDEQNELAYETNDRLLKQFPDFLFAKITKADEYIEKGQLEKVKLVLGPALDLGTLCPERHEFHISEFMIFTATVVRYYCETGDIESAQSRLEIMRGVDASDMSCQYAENLINISLLQRNFEEQQKEREGLRFVRADSYDTSVQTTEKPVFHFEEIWDLYKYDIRLDTAIFRQILLLPPEELIEDLQEVLRDSIRRYEYFRDLLDGDKITVEELDFPLHALFLLAELKAEQSLPPILEFLRQGEELLRFWLGDMLTEFIWEVVYKVGQNDLALLQAFMCERNRYAYSVSTVGAALVQIVLHHPERKAEIVSLYQNVFDYHLEHIDEKNLIDSKKMGFFICDILDINATELLPQIRKCFEHEIVATFVCGDQDEVEREIHEEIGAWRKEEILDIFDRYDEFAATLLRPDEVDEDEFFDEDDDFFENEFLDEEDEFFHDESIQAGKVGRNDPCPCGSGKKFKKCCWPDQYPKTD